MTTTLLLAVSWLIGLVIGDSGVVAPAWIIGAGALGLAGALLGWRKVASRRPFLCTLGLALGAGRMLLVQPHFDAHSLSTYNDRGPAVVRGVVWQRPDILAEEQTLTVRAGHVAGAGFDRDVEGDLLVSLDGYPRYAYGDELLLAGELTAPPRLAGFDYPQYLARQGIHSLMRRPAVQVAARGRGAWPWTWLYPAKDYLVRVIADVLPMPQSGVLAGMLLGDKSGIPTALNGQFRAVGVSHIIVISGWNIAILAGLVTAFFLPIAGRRRALWIALATVVAYVFLVGADPPVVRAAIMGSLTLVALLAGRQALALNSLALAALAMTVLRPYALWDLGFQLSFAATTSLILFAPPLLESSHALLRKWGGAGRLWLTRLIDETLVVTLAAQVLVIPLLIYHVGQLSPLMLPANVLIVPFVPAMLGLGALATLGGAIWLPLGHILGWLTWPFLAGMIRLVEWLASLPGASVSVPPLSLAFLFVYYGLMSALAVVLQRPWDEVKQVWLRVKPRVPAYLGVGALALGAVLTWAAVASQPDGQLHIYFLDVGQGDAIFIRSPSGKQILVDGGPDSPTLLSAVGQRMPFYDRRLDAVLATHDDQDHVAGLFAALEHYRVDLALDPGFDAGSEQGQRWLAELVQAGARRQAAVAGTSLALSDGVRIDILHPPEKAGQALQGNDRSAVARLVYGECSVLLMGDLEKAGEDYLLDSKQPLASGILKLSHHGAAAGTSPALLDAVAPGLAVISVGAGNGFGHPAPATLRRLEERGIPVWRTDQAGEIEIISDGKRLWVKSRR